MLANVRVPGAALDAVSAAHPVIDEHSIANLRIVDAGSNRDDDTARLVSGDQVADRPIAAGWPVPMKVTSTNRGSLHSQDNFTGARAGIRLFPHDCLTVAEELDSTHR